MKRLAFALLWLALLNSAGFAACTAGNPPAGTVCAAPPSAAGPSNYRLLTNPHIPSGIDAAKIGDGWISNTEFGRLDGITSFGQSIIDDANEAAFKATVNLEIGTDVQAFDADLTSWAAIARGANFDTFAATPSSANLRGLLTDEVGSGAAMFGLISTMADDLGCSAEQIVRRNADDTAFECSTNNSFAHGIWTYNNNISTAPNIGQVRMDSTTASAVTIIRLHYTTQPGVDAKNIIQKLFVSGVQLYIQDENDSAVNHTFTISGTLTDNTTYADIPVTWTSGSGSYITAQRVILIYRTIDTVSGGGSADGLGPDGDKGDVTVGGAGTTLQIDADAVGAAEIATGAVGSSELDEASVETEVEGVLDLTDLQDAGTNTCTGSQQLRRNSGDTAFECFTPAADDDVPEAGDFTNLSATSPITQSGGTISTSIATARLVGRTTAGSGVMEQISVNSTLSLATTTLGVVDVTCTGCLGATEIAALDAGDVTTGSFADAQVSGANEADELTLAGDVDGTANANDIDEANVEVELEGVLDLTDLQDAGTNTCTGSQQLRRNSGDTAFECFTPAADDDVPEAGDFGNLSATSPITQSGGTISTSISTARLVGRTTASAGVMEQISVDATLSLASLTLSVVDVTCTGCLGATEIAALDAGDVTTGSFADARVDGSLEADEITLAGDVDGTANANDIDEAAIENEIESVNDLLDLQDGGTNTCTGSQVVRRNAGDTAFECATISGGADGLGPDGDVGDATVGGTGTTLQIDADAVGAGEIAAGAVGSSEAAALDAGDVTTGTFADALIDGSLESDEVKPLESFCVAASDETTNLTTGTAKVTWRMPYAFTLRTSPLGVRASVNTAQTTGTVVTVDINEGGTTIISTKLTIDNNEETSTTAATAAVISDSSLADDAEMTIDIDAIGTALAKGLKVCLIGNRT